MSILQKEIVLLPYPFTNLRDEKVRPALVVSNNAFNEKSADCIMVPLTSVLKNEPFSVIISQKDMQSGKLIAESRIKADKIFCVEKSLIITKIGMLKDDVFNRVKQEMLKVF